MQMSITKSFTRSGEGIIIVLFAQGGLNLEDILYVKGTDLDHIV